MSEPRNAKKLKRIAIAINEYIDDTKKTNYISNLHNKKFQILHNQYIRLFEAYKDSNKNSLTEESAPI